MRVVCPPSPPVDKVRGFVVFCRAPLSAMPDETQDRPMPNDDAGRAPLKAKKRGLISAIAPRLQELRTKARFWIADQLEDRVLRDAGEK